jgi:hypothetical protein
VICIAKASPSDASLDGISDDPFSSEKATFLHGRSVHLRKYYAGKTIDAFSMILRDETDLEALRGDLIGVVRETM